jgi:hypothetical protein
MQPEITRQSKLLATLVAESLAGRHHLFTPEVLCRALARDETQVRLLSRSDAEQVASTVNSLPAARSGAELRKLIGALTEPAQDAVIHLWFRLVQRCGPGSPC